MSFKEKVYVCAREREREINRQKYTRCQTCTTGNDTKSRKFFTGFKQSEFQC